MLLVAPNDLPASTDTPSVDRLTFGWWNTSLSPVGKTRSDDKHNQIARAIVKSLIDDLKVDCLALGEVTNDDLIFLKEGCSTQHLAVFDGTLKTGRLQFDTGVIYNSSRLFLADHHSTTSSHGSRNFKIANRVDFLCTTDESPFHLFISHWPSRGTSEETMLTRETIAIRLKDKISEIRTANSDAAIIVAGDFNDEPFDKSLAWNLLATRDRSLAKTKSDYLYNPFWRQLGESMPFCHTRSKPNAAGSYYYKGATCTRWWTFDQILLSPSLLGSTQWHLNEEETIIVESESLIELIQNDDVTFDHLPVLSVLQRLQ